MAGQWRGSDRVQRLPANWAATRRRILRRDRGICHICHHPGADEVDHIEPGDDHADDNLAAIHSDPCHRAKSTREGVAARRAQAAARWRPPEPHPGLVR